MNSKQLSVFVEIAEAGNLHKAAERLRIAQPALSRHIRMLEEELGVKLFERHAHGVSVTAAGAELLDRARRILAAMDEARTAMMSAGGEPAGCVAVGSSTTMSKLLFARLIEHCARRFPRVRLDLIEDGFYYILQGLDTRRLNLAIMADAEPRSNLTIQSLALDALCVFGKSRHGLMGKSSISMMRLASIPLIVVRRPNGPRMTLERAAAKAGISLYIAHEIDNPEIIKELVDRNMGYGILPRCSIMEDVASRRFVAVDIEDLPLYRQLVRRSDQSESGAVGAVAEAIKAEISAMCEEGVFVTCDAGCSRAKSRSKIR